MPTGPFLPIDKPRHRRRAYADRYEANQAAGVPKAGMRVKDEAALQRARDRGRCEWPGCTYRGPCDPAHIKTRGSGGDDTDENLVSLCRPHHDAQEIMGRRGKAIMRQIVIDRRAVPPKAT